MPNSAHMDETADISLQIFFLIKSMRSSQMYNLKLVLSGVAAVQVELVLCSCGRTNEANSPASMTSTNE